jgi:hypothetical protein
VDVSASASTNTEDGLSEDTATTKKEWRQNTIYVGGDTTKYLESGWVTWVRDIFDAEGTHEYPPSIVSKELTPIWKVVQDEPTRRALYRATAIYLSGQMERARESICEHVHAAKPTAVGTYEPNVVTFPPSTTVKKNDAAKPSTPTPAPTPKEEPCFPSSSVVITKGGAQKCKTDTSSVLTMHWFCCLS